MNAAEKPESGTTSKPDRQMGASMKPAVSLALLVAMASGLSGCGSAMRDYLERPTPNQTAAVQQDLTMPPDLRLPPPGSAPSAPDGGAGSLAMAEPAPAPVQTSVSPVTQGGASTPKDSVYTQAGISLYRADGTKKTDAELKAELQALYTARKRQKNPNYGTVFNIGNIFKDE